MPPEFEENVTPAYSSDTMIEPGESQDDLDTSEKSREHEKLRENEEPKENTDLEKKKWNIGDILYKAAILIYLTAIIILYFSLPRHTEEPIPQDYPDEELVTSGVVEKIYIGLEDNLLCIAEGEVRPIPAIPFPSKRTEDLVFKSDNENVVTVTKDGNVSVQCHVSPGEPIRAHIYITPKPGLSSSGEVPKEIITVIAYSSDGDGVLQEYTKTNISGY